MVPLCLTAFLLLAAVLSAIIYLGLKEALLLAA